MDSLTCLPQHPVSHGLPFPSTLAICEPHKSSQKRPHQKSLQIHHQNHQLRFHFQTNELLGQRSSSALCVPWNLHHWALDAGEKSPRKGELDLSLNWNPSRLLHGLHHHIYPPTQELRLALSEAFMSVFVYEFVNVFVTVFYLYLYQQRSWGWPYLRHLRLLC